MRFFQLVALVLFSISSGVGCHRFARAAPLAIERATASVYRDSAQFWIPSGRTEPVWTWNEPASRRLSPAGEYMISHHLQHGWWVRVDAGNEAFEIGAVQHADYFGAMRRDSLSRLLRETTPMLFLADDLGDTAGAEARYPHLSDEQVLVRASGGYVVVTLHGEDAVGEVFRNRPPAVTVHRAVPWPVRDSVSVRVQYVDEDK